MEDAEQIRANHWRQGCVLLPEKLPDSTLKAPPISLEADDLFYVLTHDCDLVQRDFTKEPFVELLRIAPIPAPDGNYTHGKNSRQLDFTIGEAAYRADCHDRCRIDRRILAKIEPSEAHVRNAQVRDMICGWIAKRYIRPAFPDNFNTRLNQEGQNLRKFLKKHGSHFDRIYIAGAPPEKELPEEEDYRLSIWLVLDEFATDPIDASAAQQLVVEFEQILNGCKGIDVLDCRPVPESEITLADLRVMSLWDFDDLTYRERDE